MTYAPRPTCAKCGQRIKLFECLWRELGSGAVRASYAVDLRGLQRPGRRLWHVGCLAPASPPRPGSVVPRSGWGRSALA
jgi:hypothetical protein